MAEAFARSTLPSNAKIYSAGIEKHGINPFMQRVMEEAGFTMKEHFSKTVDELPPLEWDLVVSVCSHAAENCPFLPARKQAHLPFGDPPALTKGLEKEADILNIYRSVRDEIRRALGTLLREINHE